MPAEPPPGLAALLDSLGLPAPAALLPLTGGANNRVYRVEAGGQTLVVKAYFHHPADPRDRLATEFAFLRFAWAHGLRCLPQPLASDPVRHLAAYAWIPGRRLLPEELTAARISEALAFYAALNQPRSAPAAAALSAASEACFSLAAHVDTVERRLERLRRMPPETEIHQQALTFVETAVWPLWRTVAAATRQRAAALGLAWEAELPWADRRLSPSDFGYHNALLTADDHLRFIDFEYAGWDDPAKLVCDFFCQPAVPVPARFWADFVDAVVADLADPALARNRIGLLWPVYQLKWVGLRLNEFLPVGHHRRQFSGASADRRRHQLAQAQTALAAVAAARAPA